MDMGTAIGTSMDEVNIIDAIEDEQEQKITLFPKDLTQNSQFYASIIEILTTEEFTNPITGKINTLQGIRNTFYEILLFLYIGFSEDILEDMSPELTKNFCQNVSRYIELDIDILFFRYFFGFLK